MAAPAWVARMRAKQEARAKAKERQAENAAHYFAHRAYMQRVSGEIPFPVATELPIKRNLVLREVEHVAKHAKVSAL